MGVFPVSSKDRFPFHIQPEGCIHLAAVVGGIFHPDDGMHLFHQPGQKLSKTAVLSYQLLLIGNSLEVAASAVFCCRADVFRMAFSNLAALFCRVCGATGPLPRSTPG